MISVTKPHGVTRAEAHAKFSDGLSALKRDFGAMAPISVSTAEDDADRLRVEIGPPWLQVIALITIDDTDITFAVDANVEVLPTVVPPVIAAFLNYLFPSQPPPAPPAEDPGGQS